MREVRGRSVIYRAFHLKTNKKITQTTESSRISLEKKLFATMFATFFRTFLRTYEID